MKYIKVILPLKLSFEPYYRIRQDVTVGDRVTAKLSGKPYTAVVCDADATPDIDASRIQEAVLPADPLPRVTEQELAFWRFLSDYYLCSMGEIYAKAYPEQKTKGEKTLREAIRRKEEKKAKEILHKEEVIRHLIERLARKDAKLDATHGPVAKARLDEERKKLRLEISEREEQLSRFKAAGEELPEPKLPSPTRDAGAKAFIKELTNGQPCVLEGGNERHRILAETIKDTLSRRRNCLVIVPEIKASEAFIRQLRQKVRDHAVVFNSARTMSERRNAAEGLRSDGFPTVYVGTRSALFLPLENLGLIAVEAEESPYHKSPSTPRLSARDAAVVLGKIHGCPVVLSTASPSLETLLNVKGNKYDIHKTGEDCLQTETVNTGDEILKNGMAGKFTLRAIRKMLQVTGGGGRVLVLHPADDDPTAALAAFSKTLATSALVDIRDYSHARTGRLDGYGLIVILRGERLSRRIDFRSDERTLQYIHNIRRSFDGTLMIQTSAGAASTEVINYNIVAEKLLEERELFDFPPYKRMVEVKITDRSANRLNYLGMRLHEELKTIPHDVQTAPVPDGDDGETEKTVKLVFKLPRTSETTRTKREIKRIISDFEIRMKYTGHIVIDVDPI